MMPLRNFSLLILLSLASAAAGQPRPGSECGRPTAVEAWSKHLTHGPVIAAASLAGNDALLVVAGRRLNRIRLGTNATIVAGWDLDGWTAATVTTDLAAIGDGTGNVLQLSPTAGAPTHLTPPIELDSPARDLHGTRYGDLIIATVGGQLHGALGAEQRKEGQLERANAALKNLGYPRVRSVHEDLDRNLWIALAGAGILCVPEPAANRHHHWYHPSDVVDFSESSQNVWIASETSGIWSAKSCLNLSPQLPVNVLALTSDFHERLWMTTTDGRVLRIDPQDGAPWSLAEHLWIEDLGQPRATAERLRNEWIVIGFARGALMFVPGSATDDAEREPIGLEIRQTERTQRGFKGEFILRTGADNCSGLDWAYSHKLHGADARWSAPSQDGEVVYTDLSPGHYILSARAISEQGRVSKEARFRFQVKEPAPPPLSFLLALVVVSIIATYTVIRSSTYNKDIKKRGCPVD